MIWQKYKIKKNCSNTLLSGKYPVKEIFVGKKSGREIAPSWKCPLGEYPSKKCQLKSPLSVPVKELPYIVQSINFKNTLGHFLRKYVFLCTGCFTREAGHWTFRKMFCAISVKCFKYFVQFHERLHFLSSFACRGLCNGCSIKRADDCSLKLHSHSSFVYKRFSSGCSTIGTGHCSFRKAF